MKKIIFCFLFYILTTQPAKSNEYTYEVDGFEIYTAIDGRNILEGLLVVNTPISSDEFLTIPYFYEGNVSDTSLSVTFQGMELDLIGGVPFVTDTVGYLVIDVSHIEEDEGELRFLLQSTEEVTLTLISNIEEVNEIGNEPTEGDRADTSAGSLNYSMLLVLLFLIFYKLHSMQIKPPPKQPSITTY